MRRKIFVIQRTKQTTAFRQWTTPSELVLSLSPKAQKNCKGFVIFAEMFLIVTMSVAVSYILGEAYSGVGELGAVGRGGVLDKIKNAYKIFILLFFNEKNLVSALDASDLDPETGGAYTCLVAKDGSVCQEYPGSECADKCSGPCIPTLKGDVNDCRIGTCFDPNEGLCAAGSPKSACEKESGNWFDDPYGNVLQCKRGCCALGEQTKFTTQRECAREGELLGIAGEFKPEVNTEIACLASARSQDEGACVIEFEFERTCKFTTKSNCLEIGGDFNEGLLCSNSELKTNCEKQKTAQCVEGRDEIYWFDSCGNRENIYSANKVQSWNDGEVLSKEDSCSIGTLSDPLRNQNSCGNCNYLLGSICGGKTSSEKLSDSNIDFVCRDLSCEDSDGKKRANGESWCEYNSAIGMDTGTGGEFRSVDTPGSRHFRQLCLDGEISTAPCADYRNEICIEAQTDVQGGGKFSSAACRINRWQQCLNYNTEIIGQDGKTKRGAELKSAEQSRDNKCEQNPDCFVKKVNVDSKGFNFNICAPKYPPGFDLNDNGEAGEVICSFASQTCTVIYVKKPDGWECKQNCDCETREFTEKMNDLCISLGDCGVSVNYEGDFGIDEKYVKRAPRLNNNYLSGVKGYSEPRRGEFAEVGDLEAFYGDIGIPAGLGNAETPGDATAQITGIAGVTSGLLGAGLIVGVKAGIITSSFLAVPAAAAGAKPALTAWGGALAGAAIGLAATSLLIKFTGIGRGLSPIIVYTLMAAGAYAGLVIGASLASTAPSLCGALFGCIVAVGILITILILTLLGVGDTKKKKVAFTCSPWQPPFGGAKCSQCGKEGLPCSKYACQALGQTCEFLEENEGVEGAELCINVARADDTAAPTRSPWQEVLTQGFSYQGASANGVTIRAPKECVEAYESFTFGISLDEPGQCRFDTIRNTNFEDMEFNFGGRSLFLRNHTQFFTAPNFESLGIPGYDPTRRADYNLYVRCRDKIGNVNLNDYVINFCVKPGADVSPPLVNEHAPDIEFLKYGETSVDVSVWTNEPSECKWEISNRDYDAMANVMQCENDIEDMGLNGWRCDSTLPISADNNRFYVRCKDQPWLIESQNLSEPALIVVKGEFTSSGQQRYIEVDPRRKRNAMTESYIIDYRRSLTPLNIDSIIPDGQTIISGVEPVSVEVIATTSGGVDGTAECSYGVGNNLFVTFLNTLGRVHRQFFRSFTAGEKVLPIRCEDVAGNTAEKTARFNIEIDSTMPEITRVYNDFGELVVVTSENAECAFVASSQENPGLCNFDFEQEGVVKMFGEELRHEASFDEDLNHYIKCRDEFGNSRGGCDIVVKGGAF